MYSTTQHNKIIYNAHIVSRRTESEARPLRVYALNCKSGKPNTLHSAECVANHKYVFLEYEDAILNCKYAIFSVGH